jgi:Nicotinic acid mononucleotide adenylyltransferase
MAPDTPQLRWLRRAPEGIFPDMRTPRLGVLSGTFNPPTRAHLALAGAALEQLGLQEVLFVLPEVPPHKRELEATLADRSAMLMAALKGKTQFSAAMCTHGLFVDIHRAIAPEFPAGTEVFFLAGRDAAERILLHWPYDDPARALAEMFGRFQLGVASRGGQFRIPPDSPAHGYGGRVHNIALAGDVEAVSATLAREKLGRGEPVDHILPRAVADYIRANGLYVSPAG